MKLVYATRRFSTTTDTGKLIRVYPGEAWDKDDPIVKAHKDAFSDEPVRIRTSQGWVETATAAPGEKRKSGR